MLRTVLRDGGLNLFICHPPINASLIEAGGYFSEKLLGFQQNDRAFERGELRIAERVDLRMQHGLAFCFG